MSVIARQFGCPQGPIGRLVGRMMARGNGDFNRWVVGQIRHVLPGRPDLVVELGSGPGVCLHELLRGFPEARVWGIDPSRDMLAQARRRNANEVSSGRLVLVLGDVRSLAALPPADLVVACHVLYFWHEPARELASIHAALPRGGRIALGYQLRNNMPTVVQRNFPREGHLLYDNDNEVSGLLAGAGFNNLRIFVKGGSEKPEGRLALGEG